LAVEQGEKVDSPDLVTGAARLERLLRLRQQPGLDQAAFGVRADELGMGAAYPSAERGDGTPIRCLGTPLLSLCFCDLRIPLPPVDWQTHRDSGANEIVALDGVPRHVSSHPVADPEVEIRESLEASDAHALLCFGDPRRKRAQMGTSFL
jgi:hypothetical protein